jgi:hypothetical protein
MKPYEFKAGDKVNYLKLIKTVYVKGNGSKGRLSWVCECVCGREVIRRQDFLGSKRAKSCGCQSASLKNTGPKDKKWRGCGELSGQYFSYIRCGAKKRDIEFAITIDYAWELFENQGRRCTLTGLPLVFHSHRERLRGLQQTASLDRIDSTKGYVPGNVQWVHKDVNMMKKEYDQARFVEVCKLVAQNAA